MIRCNRAIVAGNLTRDIELKYTNSQRAVASFSVAVNRSVKQPDGSYKDVADFVPVQVWGRSAEACQKYLRKGDNILVEGRINTRSYETQGGEKRWTTEVVAESVQFPSRKDAGRGDAGQSGQGGQYSRPPQSRRNDWNPLEPEPEPAYGTPQGQDGDTADIPF